MIQQWRSLVEAKLGSGPPWSEKISEAEVLEAEPSSAQRCWRQDRARAPVLEDHLAAESHDSLAGELDSASPPSLLLRRGPLPLALFATAAVAHGRPRCLPALLGPSVHPPVGLAAAVHQLRTFWATRAMPTSSGCALASAFTPHGCRRRGCWPPDFTSRSATSCGKPD